jgi:hypothetical protein
MAAVPGIIIQNVTVLLVALAVSARFRFVPLGILLGLPAGLGAAYFFSLFWRHWGVMMQLVWKWALWDPMTEVLDGSPSGEDWVCFSLFWILPVVLTLAAIWYRSKTIQTEKKSG